MMPNAKLLRVIEEQWLDRIVKMTKERMEHSKVYGRICKDHGWFSGESCPSCSSRRHSPQILQRAQLSNLKNLADSMDSIPALELFIRYQMGRKEGEGWRYEADGGERFGNQVIADLEELGKWAEQIDPDDPKPVHLWLIRLYTGFLLRWYVAFAGEAQTEGEVEET